MNRVSKLSTIFGQRAPFISLVVPQLYSGLHSNLDWNSSYSSIELWLWTFSVWSDERDELYYGLAAWLLAHVQFWALVRKHVNKQLKSGKQFNLLGSNSISIVLTKTTVDQAFCLAILTLQPIRYHIVKFSCQEPICYVFKQRKVSQDFMSTELRFKLYSRF